MGLRILLLFLMIVNSVAGAPAAEHLRQSVEEVESFEADTVEFHSSVTGLFVFGDSVVDAGTNALFPSLLRADYEPYGQQFGRPTGRFTNGRTYADFFASKLGLPLVEPYLKRGGKSKILKGVNYASAGSGLLRATNAENVVIPFPDQITQFEQTMLQITEILHGEESAKKQMESSLFLINIGGNDVVLYASNPTVTPEAFHAQLIGILEDSIKVLYKNGARKLVVMGVGPVGCVPGVLVMVGVTNGQCIEPFNEVGNAFNAAVKKFVLEELPKKFPGLNSIFANPFDIMISLLNDQSNGFTNGVNACCGTGLYNAESQCGRPSNLITNPPTNVCKNVEKHIFWDYFHPTERAYRIASEKFWSGSTDFVEPINLKTLVRLR